MTTSKFFLGLTFLCALTLGTFASAFNDIRLDCRRGDDGMGGKYCHYNLSKCTADTCEEAAKCAIELVARERIGKKFKATQISETTQVSLEGEMFNSHEMSAQKGGRCASKACVEPFTVYTEASIVSPGKCEPVVIQ